MAKSHKPRKGSRAFWPKKRAKKIYPSINVSPKPGMEKIIPLAYAGYKAGMTQVSFVNNKKESPTAGKEITEAVTVLDCPPLSVIGIKLYRREVNGLINEGTVLEENLPKDLTRKMDIPKKKHMNKELIGKKLDQLEEIRLLVSTQPRESGLGKKTPEVFEIPVSGGVEKQWAYALEKLGKEILPEDVFSSGEVVDVNAVTKGKGFSGVVKRFGVKVRSRKDGGKRRHIGTMGPVTPGRVLPGKIPQAGQLGLQTRTEFNKKILKIGAGGIEPKGGFVNYGKVPKNHVILSGSVPGPKKRLIMIRKAERWTEKPQPVELNHISLGSQN